MVEKDTYIRAAMDEIERIKNDEDKYIEYELRERAIRDYICLMATKLPIEAIRFFICFMVIPMTTQLGLSLEKCNKQPTD